MGCSPSGFSRPVFLWALTALAIEISVQALVRDNASPALRLLHLLPLLPLTFFFVLLARTIIWKMDEMQRRLRGIDELEQRVTSVEQRLDKLEGKGPSASASSRPKKSTST